MSEAARSEIVLIGPVGSGKSTVGKLLAEKLGLPEVAMDDARWAYYAEIGYSTEEAERRQHLAGFRGKYEYWKPFEIHALERLLDDNRNCVVHLGAGHSVYEDEALFLRAQSALAPFMNVVLLLPSPDSDRSIELLAARSPRTIQGEWDFNAHFVRHPSNQLLAKHVVYTEGRSPDDTTNDVLRVTRFLESTAGRDAIGVEL